MPYSADYTLDQEQLILSLVKHQRKQLQEDREALRKADHLTDRKAESIQSELDDLSKLENKNREKRLK